MRLLDVCGKRKDVATRQNQLNWGREDRNIALGDEAAHEEAALKVELDDGWREQLLSTFFTHGLFDVCDTNFRGEWYT